MKLKIRTGFTLIELMVVIIILGVLLLIGMINYLSTIDRANVSALKLNISVLRVSAEMYSMDNVLTADTYFNLKNDAISKKYWKSFENPWTSRADNGLDMIHTMSPSLTDETFNNAAFLSTTSQNTPAAQSDLLGGTVIYCGGDSSDQSSLYKYAIYGANKSTSSSVLNTLMYEDKVYYLSNG